MMIKVAQTASVPIIARSSARVGQPCAVAKSMSNESSLNSLYNSVTMIRQKIATVAITRTSCRSMPAASPSKYDLSPAG